MKVLIINQHIKDVIGGSEIQCDIIARKLKKLGHDVAYLAVKARNPENNYDSDYKVYPVNKLSILKLLNILKDFKPDIIYWRFNKHGLMKAALISKIKRIKFVFGLSALTDVKKWVLKKNNSSFINLIANLIFLFKERINYLGFYFIDGVVSLNNYLLSQIPKKVKYTTCIRDSMESETYGVFEWKKPYVIWVANIKKNKNPEKFIELAKKFNDDSIDFLMVGKIQEQNYNYILNKENLPSNCYYLGPKTPTEVNSIIKSSLFLVHTCDPEGFGNNFIQAWLQGKPTISLYFDPDNIIKTNKIGFHSKKQDQFYKDVKFYIINNEARKSDGEKAKNFAEKVFNPKKNVKKLECFLLKVIENR